MLKSGTRPPSGVNESCILLTAPQEAAVVTVAKSDEAGAPKRTSLPSMLPALGETPSVRTRGLPALSARQQTRAAARNRMAMALQTAQPCFGFLTFRPR